jgi:Na+/H+ antiporter NhaA
LNPIDQAGRGKRPYMSNRDLLVIAILSGMGGVMSTYIGYLAHQKVVCRRRGST